MGPRVVTTVFCLLSLLAEITLDPSTNFVRVSAPRSVGKLAIRSAQAEKRGPEVPNTPDRQTQDELPGDHLSLDQPTHAADRVDHAEFRPFLAVGTRPVDTHPSYLNPVRPQPQRPPIAC